MTKFLAVTTLFAALNLGAYTEGVDYIKLEKPLSVAKDSVVKIFSYACQYCYKFDKSVTPKVAAELEKGKFSPFHLSSKGSFGETASHVFIVTLLQDEEAGVDIFSDKSKFKKAKMAIYKATHDKGEKFQTNDGKSDKAAFLKFALDAAGMSLEEYENALKNPLVKERFELWQESYEVAKLQGVPTFVVGGKYAIDSAKIKSISDLNKLIKELQSK
ncbi:MULTISPECIES: thiol:disulfide interchange protein DsbA/DsbL [unclassified Campylobacter]|uniref:thiol:disulfide interchange protein DsbA/DsbL n=1 Tax=unclassified Campylobacter TaxID=2593542 RepID=UPI003D34A8DF